MAPTLDQLLSALAAHQWPMVVGILVYVVVALAKQGHLSTWLAAHVPSAYQPLLAFLLAQASTATVAIVSGSPWSTAVLQAVEATAYAIMTHEVVIESARKGKELVKPSAKILAFRALKTITKAA